MSKIWVSFVKSSFKSPQFDDADIWVLSHNLPPKPIGQMHIEQFLGSGIPSFKQTELSASRPQYSAQ